MDCFFASPDFFDRVGNFFLWQSRIPDKPCSHFPPKWSNEHRRTQNNNKKNKKMAAGQGSSSQSRQIISRLVGRIGELSQELDAEQSSFKPTSDIEPTELTEAEIRRVFGCS